MKKRALALVCAFAMGMTMCAGTSVSNTAKAAADDSTETIENEATDVSDDETVAIPQVRIVGATISNQNGLTQKLRFLMEVKNYDQIKVSEGQDFGINFTVNDMATQVTYKEYNKIYAVDEINKTLQYAVEINGINSDNIDTNITAQGFVTGSSSEGGTVTSEKATKSVSSVATAAGYKITVDKNNNNYMTLNKNFDTRYSLDLTKAQVIDGKGTIERDSFSGIKGIKARDVYGITVPIHDKGFVVGSDVEVTIYGTASGSSVRAWIQQNNKDIKATDIKENVTTNSVIPLKIKASVDSSVLFIKAPYPETFNELNISKIDVKVLPFAKPAEDPGSYTLKFDDKTVKGSQFGNVEINGDGNVKTVKGTIAGPFGNFEFDLPDEVVSNYYDTVTVKFKDADYSGNTADIWMALDTVNNGLLTDELKYGDYFHHAIEGEAVAIADSGPIKNVRIWAKDATSDKPFKFTIESVIFSRSYELELNSTNVVADDKVDLTFNDDESVTIETKGTTPEDKGSFCFKIPEKIYKENDFRKIAISYRDSNLMECLHYTQHYGTDDNGKDISHWINESMLGDGTHTFDLDPATEEGNFSNMKFFDFEKPGRKMIITSVRLAKYTR